MYKLQGCRPVSMHAQRFLLIGMQYKVTSLHCAHECNSECALSKAPTNVPAFFNLRVHDMCT